MKVRYSYLPQQFGDCDDLWDELKAFVATGDFTLGKPLESFEEQFSELIGTQHAIGVNSGTDAIKLSLKALGIGPGDEVITAPNSFIASAASIARTGAKVVLSDVGDDMNLDPKELDKAIGPTTKAIMPVHLTGKVANMEAILSISESYGLFVVEDAAQAPGCKYKGRYVGTIGDIGIF